MSSPYSSELEQSTPQLIVDQLEELVFTIVEEIRERPAVAAAILAGVVGAIAGSIMAASAARRRHAPAPLRVVQRAKGVGEMAELAAITARLLQNPIVRAFLWSAIERQIKRRFSLGKT